MQGFKCRLAQRFLSIHAAPYNVQPTTIDPSVAL
jgi:hypothetical protein